MAYVTPVRTVMTSSKVSKISPQTLAKLGFATAATSSCWTAWAYFDKNAIAGNTVYSWWQTLTWCSTNGTTITSHTVVDRGGETSSPGWSYTGHGLANNAIVGNQIRQYTQEKFTFSVAWTSFTSTECAQIRGTATGTPSVLNSCSLA